MVPYTLEEYASLARALALWDAQPRATHAGTIVAHVAATGGATVATSLATVRDFVNERGRGLESARRATRKRRARRVGGVVVVVHLI